MSGWWLAGWLSACGTPAPEHAGFQTPKTPVVDTYQGVKVTDDYRWLEAWDDPAVKEWSAAENALATQALAEEPVRAAVEKELTAILGAEVVKYGGLDPAGGQLFAIERHPPKIQPYLVVMPSADRPDQERILVDPAAIDPTGHTAIDWYRPSPDGKQVAVSLSVGGTESGDVHLFDVATGAEQGEVVPRVNGGTAGGDLAWVPDGSGFYYTRYPRGDERPAADQDFYQQLYFHRLGTPTTDDTYQVGKEFPRVAEVVVEVDASGLALVTVQNGDGGQTQAWLGRDGDWRPLDAFDDPIQQVWFGKPGELLVLSRDGAPRGKLLRMGVDQTLADATPLIPEGPDTIVWDFGGEPTAGRLGEALYVLYQTGGPSELRLFDATGAPLPPPTQLPVSSVSLGPVLPDGSLLFGDTSFVEPLGWYRFDPGEGTTTKTPLSTLSPVTLGGVEVVRELATSKDGTKVPVNLLVPAGAPRDGTAPCVLTGYGGYGVNREPTFNPALKVLLDRGVIFGFTNLRGGGEFGQDWHDQGRLTKKQNVFDDFAAAMQYVVDQKYTSPEHLAITGRSNGGLLMGAALTQHPDLVKAVVSGVGIYDMLRVERSANGSFNVEEFGTVTDPDQFAALYAYSPYHHVVDGTAYPAILMTTGENDPRVDPLQSRKMVARLQAAQGGDAPILLRTYSGAGHGLDLPLAAQIEQATDADAFLLDQLGIQR